MRTPSKYPQRKFVHGFDLKLTTVNHWDLLAVA